MLKCDMFKDCTAAVSMIDGKGYVYCAVHGVMRKRHMNTRKLKPKELERLQAGLPLLSKTQAKLERIGELCANAGIEIVSHGLAPNPNGFCYETSETTSKSDCEKLDKLLNALSYMETQQLIKATF